MNDPPKQPDLYPEDALIDAIMAEYRNEVIAAMNRYHRCDIYNNERSCRADVYRVDHVFYPVARKMLEDMFEAARDRQPAQ